MTKNTRKNAIVFGASPLVSLKNSVVSKKSVLSIASQTSTKYNPQNGGAIDFKGLKRKVSKGASAVGRGVATVGKGVVGAGVTVGKGVVVTGAQAARVQYEAWKREKLGEYPYGAREPTDAWGRPIKPTFSGSGFGGQGTGYQGYGATIAAAPFPMFCPVCKDMKGIGARVLIHGKQYVCPHCGSQLYNGEDYLRSTGHRM